MHYFFTPYVTNGFWSAIHTFSISLKSDTREHIHVTDQFYSRAPTMVVLEYASFMSPLYIVGDKPD